MLSLSWLPCTDGNACDTGEQAKISAAANHQDHHENAETCTPFCTCSCCSVSAFYSNAAKIQTTKIVFQSEKYPLYNIAFYTEVYYSVWHPPKIS